MRSILSGLTLAGALFIAVPALSAVDAFIWFDGINGEFRARQGALEVTDWSFGSGGHDIEISENRTGAHGAGGGGGAGKVAIQDIHITRTIDSSSPKLFQAATSGHRFAKVTLSVRKAGGTQQEFLKVDLSDVLISQYQRKSSGADHPTESFTLNFAKITWTYEQAGKTATDDWSATSGATTATNPWAH